MYQHAVHFIFSERGENKLNITFTKNLFHKEASLMGYDPMLFGDPLKHCEPVTHWHSDISHKTWVFSNAAVRILSSMTVRTSKLAILYILFCYVVFYEPNAQYLPVVGGFSIKEQWQIFPVTLPKGSCRVLDLLCDNVILRQINDILSYTAWYCVS
jgi:hypothetical protein